MFEKTKQIMISRGPSGFILYVNYAYDKCRHADRKRQYNLKRKAQANIVTD